MPREEFLFAVDPVPTDPKRPEKWVPDLREGQGLLQVQRWMTKANITATERRLWQEPVADWVVADVVATRGTYLGGKQFVNLPLWSSEYNRYTLREVAAERGKKDIKKMGVVMDPTKPGPQFAVVDVEGGLRHYRHLMKNINIDEQTANEVLLMDESGDLRIRSSYADRFDVERGQREDYWKNWIKRTEEDTNSLVPDTKQNPKGFQ